MWLKDGAGVQYQLSAVDLGAAIEGAAGQHIGCGGDTSGRSGSLIVSALTTPPEDTLSVPPLPTDTPLAVTPEDTFIVPPLLTEVASAVPPEETFNRAARRRY